MKLLDINFRVKHEGGSYMVYATPAVYDVLNVETSDTSVLRARTREQVQRAQQGLMLQITSKIWLRPFEMKLFQLLR